MSEIVGRCAYAVKCYLRQQRGMEQINIGQRKVRSKNVEFHIDDRVEKTIEVVIRAVKIL